MGTIAVSYYVPKITWKCAIMMSHLPCCFVIMQHKVCCRTLFDEIVEKMNDHFIIRLLLPVLIRYCTRKSSLTRSVGESCGWHRRLAVVDSENGN